MVEREHLINLVEKGIIAASTSLNSQKKQAYLQAIETETNKTAKDVLKLIVENYEIANAEKKPLCDDTGIPHIVVEVGSGEALPEFFFDAIDEGIRRGLMALPGRPMAVKGEELARVDQSEGLSDDPADVAPAPILLIPTYSKGVKVHILMLGGGPAIRGMTYRIFHKHSINVVVDEICERAIEAVDNLGCTPCTLAIGVGRSQYEASSMMLMAMIEGQYNKQTTIESEITERVNQNCSGPLGVGGNTSVLATFLKIGPQRASGVRIVCIRPCCCFEPRLFSFDL